MSSNPLYGLQKVGIFVHLTGLPGRPMRQPVFAGCTWRLCDRRLRLVTRSALEVCIHEDTLYKLATFTFTFGVILASSQVKFLYLSNSQVYPWDYGRGQAVALCCRVHANGHRSFMSLHMDGLGRYLWPLFGGCTMTKAVEGRTESSLVQFRARLKIAPLHRSSQLLVISDVPVSGL